MIKGKKILIVLMALVLIAVGANCIQAAEINNEESTNLQENEYKVGMVTLESILSLHPELEELYIDYQEELAELTAENDSEIEEVEELKQKYIIQLIDKIQDDLEQFTSNLGLDSLVIDNTIVSGNLDLNLEELPNIQDVTGYLEEYLTKSESN
ncbi:hypothetical protein GM661_03285 [Iocasia frigidifontis]|uniref:Uncharacterized protein n=1 Tax=Iocasia fonsfrigidae TaxID=2682810 RepID=A0A8A7KCF5_9FIRM|nr:hypothetical protein [Iocasia fonsfrigidae]QTL97069.1 hypothetical protein GM661_03285 [Iocasia fonsfrigidae]